MKADEPDQMATPPQIPSQYVARIAGQFLDAAKCLRAQLGSDPGLTPIFTCAAFAIELYLKSFDAVETEHPLCRADGTIAAYAMSAKVKSRGHNLLKLYEALPDNIRTELEGRYAVMEKKSRQTLRRFLDYHQTTFVDTRYVFDEPFGLPRRGAREIDDMIRAAECIAALVAELLRGT